MLPSSPQVQEVYLGERGILAALSQLDGASHDTLCIDSTTLGIQIAKDVAEKVHKSGSKMVDAPVSGGVPSS